MDDSLHTHDLLVRYLDGDLPLEQKQALEQKLQSDNALQDELRNLELAIQAVRQFGTTQQVNAIHHQVMAERKERTQAKVVPFRKTFRYAMAVAASAIILFFGFRLFINAQPSPEKIYSEAFVDFNLSAVRGSEGNGSEIEKFYQQKNYAAVTTTIRSRVLSAKDSLLIGLSYLHLDKSAQAVRFFEQMTIANSDFQQDAEFYLSLGYLKEKRYEQAAGLMKKIAANPAHLYHDQITNELVEDVESLQKK